jgi:hypothetical protein
VPFSDAEVQQVWEKGKPSSKPDEWRFDDCGAWIGRNLYGNRGSPFGWEIDHIKPIIAGGTDALSNSPPSPVGEQCREAKWTAHLPRDS